MPVLLILLLLFIGLPTVEIYVLIKVGHEIGALWTIVLLFAIAALGSALLRLEGLATLRKVQAAMARGEVPTAAILDGLVLVVAGVLMVTPGFVTDLFAFLLLLPPLRRAIGALMASRLMLRAQGRAAPGGARPSGPQVLEGDYRVERDP